LLKVGVVRYLKYLPRYLILDKPLQLFVDSDRKATGGEGETIGKQI